MQVKDYKGVSKAAIQRMPKYLRYLLTIKNDGEQNISSTDIANALNLNPVLVRKDLSYVSSVAGKPKTGFSVSELIVDLKKFLGYNNLNDAVLVGVGHLGKALLSYSGFNSCGINIVAAFDNDELITDTYILDKRIFSTKILEEKVKELGAKIGIITVPTKAAQTVCDMLVAGGVKAIWNFAPMHLQVPDEIVIKNEDLAGSLALLSQKMANRIENN